MKEPLGIKMCQGQGASMSNSRQEITLYIQAMLVSLNGGSGGGWRHLVLYASGGGTFSPVNSYHLLKFYGGMWG